MKAIATLLFILYLYGSPSVAQTSQAQCDEMQIWDYQSTMCMPLTLPGMPMKMLMLHGNGFLVGDIEEGSRGRDRLSAPDMLMGDIGLSVGDHHYLNLEYMGTFEKWTYPQRGYPELLQIGEENSVGQPYVDAQHPHSSPVMGLTLSDTISLGQKNYLKTYFAPRGESGDGPVAFMHRPTAMVNPDAPLGHHIGQDVGHISSTVIGAEISEQNTTLQLTSFHGAEPEPSRVDLKIGAPDSYAIRVVRQFGVHAYAMASVAYVYKPELLEPIPGHIWRYSTSYYLDTTLAHDWHWNETFVYGLVNNYDHAAALNSFLYEFWLHKKWANFWGRIEVLQRTANELAVPLALDENGKDANRGRWVEALTVGYTQTLKSWDTLELSLGGSLTKEFLPEAYRSAYGNPLSGRAFLQLNGMKMWDL